jgi:crossover junction endodeoxyribonuclease RusA
MRLMLPMPPSVNNQYVTVNGRRALSKEAARFKRTVRDHLRREIAAGRIGADELARLEQGYLALFIDFFFETPLRRDLDGGLKITQDAICETLDINDNRVVDIHLVKRIDPLRPRIEVELEAIERWEFDQQYEVLRTED